MRNSRNQAGSYLNRFSIAAAIFSAGLIATPFFYPEITRALGKSREDIDREQSNKSRQEVFHTLIPQSPQPAPVYTPDDAKRDLSSLTLDMSTPYTLRQIRELAEATNRFTIVAPNNKQVLVYLVPLTQAQKWKERRSGANLEEVTRLAVSGEVTVWAGNIPARREEELYLFQFK